MVPIEITHAPSRTLATSCIGFLLLRFTQQLVATEFAVILVSFPFKLC